MNEADRKQTASVGTSTAKLHKIEEKLDGMTRTSSVFDKATLVPVGFVVTIVTGIIAVVWAYAGITHSIENLEKEVSHMREHISAATVDRFTANDFRGWLRLLKIANSGKEFTIPDWER